MVDGIQLVFEVVLVVTRLFCLTDISLWDWKPFLSGCNRFFWTKMRKMREPENAYSTKQKNHIRTILTHVKISELMSCHNRFSGYVLINFFNKLSDLYFLWSLLYILVISSIVFSFPFSCFPTVEYITVQCCILELNPNKLPICQRGP